MNVCRKKENPLQQNEKKKTQHDDNVMRQRETTAERQTDKRTAKTQKTTKDTKSQLEKVTNQTLRLVCWFIMFLFESKPDVGFCSCHRVHSNSNKSEYI